MSWFVALFMNLTSSVVGRMVSLAEGTGRWNVIWFVARGRGVIFTAANATWGYFSRYGCGRNPGSFGIVLVHGA